MRRVPQPLFLLAVLAVAAMAVASAGCSQVASNRGPADHGTASPATDDDPLLRALEATRAVESGRMELTTVLDVLSDVPDPPPGGRATVAVHRVAFDRRARRVAVETDMPALTPHNLGVGASAHPADRSVPLRMVAVGDVVYVQDGPLAAALGRRTTDWGKVDRAGFVDQRPDSDTGALVLDPLGPFDVLGDAAGDVRPLGDEEVRGTPVTHLTGRLGVGAGDGGARIDVWLDADGVVRRLRLRLPSGSAVGDDGIGVGRLITTVELYDVGAPVAVVPPDPSEVLDPNGGR
jgi:hypothetical protein